MDTQMLETVRIPSSFYYNGLWLSADWSATVVDAAKGDVLLTAVLPQVGEPGPLAALRLGMEDVAALRRLAGFGKVKGDGYDCRTLTERVAFIESGLAGEGDENIGQFGRLKGIERRQEDDALTFGQHARRLEEIEQRLDDLQQTSNRLVLFAGSDQEVKDLAERIAAIESVLGFKGQFDRLPKIEEGLAALERQQREQSLVLVSHEQRLEAVDAELGDQTQRLSALENTKPQPPSAIEALRQIANIQARDPDGLKMTWAEMALACIRIAENALEQQ